MLRRSVTVLTSPLRVFRGLVLASLGMMLWAMAAVAEPLTFPDLFKSRLVAAGDTKLYIRSAGTGPAVVLLHGYGETGDMWVPLANELVSTHTVIVPDLRGLGLSERAEKGFEKKNQANDIIAVMDALQVAKADVVAHDIGNMVAYALAAQYPERVNKLIMMDAPVPGVGPWEDILKNPLLWHFRFGGPDMERLVSGRERIYLDRFWNEFSADPKRFSEAARQHYAALYARPGAMHAGFEQFKAFDQDAIDNRALQGRGKLKMPVLAVGGEKSFGLTMAEVMRAVAEDVHAAVIPDAGHWLMEEQPAKTVGVVRAFLDQPNPTTR